MSIRKRTFVREVMKRVSDLGELDGYFYIKPVDHILCGCVCSLSPSGRARFKTFALPLYDRIDHLHSVFAEALPSPFDSLSVVSKNSVDLAVAFVERMEMVREKVAGQRVLSGFLNYIGARGFGNIWYRRGYALTLIMLDRSAEAVEHLNALQDMSLPEDCRKFKTEIEEVCSNLKKSPRYARDLLMCWEKETKMKFGLLEHQKSS